MLQQGDQDLERFLLQMELSTAFPQFACFRVGIKRTNAKGKGEIGETRYPHIYHRPKGDRF
ncbi:MAG: hypothetical protein DMG30_23020 [Acidobacteria bacterium]|nr:MAG: hypothetical protein DMG30_23020 [Acidobacteriota bacterium]